MQGRLHESKVLMKRKGGSKVKKSWSAAGIGYIEDNITGEEILQGVSKDDHWARSRMWEAQEDRCDGAIAAENKTHPLLQREESGTSSISIKIQIDRWHYQLHWITNFLRKHIRAFLVMFRNQGSCSGG
jgi:hypothetical protein